MNYYLFIFLFPIFLETLEIGDNNDIPFEFFEEYVNKSAVELIKKYGFDAGGGYPEVWIRDTNTFLQLAIDNFSNITQLRNNLTVFFGFQQDDGSIIDGFMPKDKAPYPYYKSKYFPQYAGFKNTVEIDQETSLIQAFYQYITSTGDRSILSVKFGEFNISQRMEQCLEYLLKNKYNEKYGLLYSATRADWGDVQPEDSPGVLVDNNTHWAISIYDNAMFIISVNNFIEIFPEKKEKWKVIAETFKKNIRQHLWTEKPFQKFIPHLYLDKGSPFPKSFDENEIYYNGGTATAILAGILTKEEEIIFALNKMIENIGKIPGGVATIGMTMYPAYPDGFFKNPGLKAYSYQNGGDWTWFGARMVWALIENGYVEEAKKVLLPMLRRVWTYGDFYEWYYVYDNSPRGSNKFKGSAGVLYKAIKMLNNT